jgi:hypothetical protein
MLRDSKVNSTPLGRPQLAYQACLPEMQRLRTPQVQALNLDVMDAVRTVRGASERLSTLRAAAEASFNDFDLSLWDKLETYTFALIHAHDVYVLSVRSCAVPSDLVNDAQQKFELLYAVAQGLVSRRLLDPSILKRAKGRRGQLRYAYGSLLLVEKLREAWPTLADKTGLSEDELTQAELSAERLASGVAKKNGPKEHAEQLAEMRDRAFTLFIYAYGHVRRAVQYLRWDHNDADAFAPSLYRRRHTPRAKARSLVDSPSASVMQPEHSVPDQQQQRDSEIDARVTDANVPTLECSASSAVPASASMDAARRKRARAKHKSHENVARFRAQMRRV